MSEELSDPDDPMFARVSDRGKAHLIAKVNEYGHGIAECGRTFQRHEMRPVRTGEMALEVADDLCELCRRAHTLDAGSDLMTVYELADEYEGRLEGDI